MHQYTGLDDDIYYGLLWYELSLVIAGFASLGGCLFVPDHIVPGLCLAAIGLVGAGTILSGARIL